MMISKLKIGVGAVVLLGMVAGLFFQRQQIRRLTDENADLRSQLNQMASLRDSNGHLADELKATVESSQASKNELTRLRGQAVRLHQLEQENAQPKSQREQLDRQMQQAQLAVVSSQPGEVTVVSEVTRAGNGFPEANTTDLGTLELYEGTPTRFDLGGGTNCVVTPTTTPDGNATVEIAMGITNADGTVSELGKSRITARPDQHCSISVGDRMIALAVKLKMQ